MDLTIAHRILGINSFSTQDEVKYAYKMLVKTWHPDKHINDKIKYAYAEENIKKIIEAYKYLLNHNSWKNRNEVTNTNNKKYKYHFKKVFYKIINYVIILFQYTFILLGLPFIIFWYHPIHNDIFPSLHKNIKNNYNLNESEIMLFFENFDSINFLDKDSTILSNKIMLNIFLDLLIENNKSNQINFIDLDDDKVNEMIINVSSMIKNEYYQSIMLFNYKNNNVFSFVKTFDNGTILDYNNKVFIQPVEIFSSFYFCDSCYIASEIINNKDISYISPKIKYIYKNEKIFYKTIDKSLNKKIINNLISLSKFDFKIANNKFDKGIRRLYAENISSYYYNNFDLNKARDIFYDNYIFLDKHKVWKGIVVELIKEHPIIKTQ